MQKTTSVSKSSEIKNAQEEMEPSQQTLTNILQFAAAFKSQKIAENVFVNMIIN